jgi:hypothetical protein
MVLIAQIALGVIIGGLTIALQASLGQGNKPLSVGLFIAGGVIAVALVTVLTDRKKGK